MRITVEIIKETNGMKPGTRKNLQPFIANQLIKKGIAKKVGQVGNIVTVKGRGMVDKKPVTVELKTVAEKKTTPKKKASPKKKKTVGAKKK